MDEAAISNAIRWRILAWFIIVSPPSISIPDPQIPRQVENSEVAFDLHIFNEIDVAVMKLLRTRENFEL